MAKEEPKFKAKVIARPVKGFYRCGIKFTAEAQEVEVTADQLATLKAEKNLVVTELGPVEKKKEVKDEDKEKK